MNGEGTNTQSMQQHAMTKQAIYKGGLKHESVNLLMSDLLDLTQSCILNAKQGDLLSGNILSDADAQLIIKLVFKEKVSVSELIFATIGQGKPEVVKIYSNKPTLDFSDISDVEPGAEAKFLDSEESQNIILAGKNFSRVSSIQIFVEDNHSGSDQTKLDSLKVIGSAAPNYHVEYKSK